MEPSTNNPALDCSMIPGTLSVTIDGFRLPNEALATGIHAAASDLDVPDTAPAALSTGVALALESIMESHEAIRQKLAADPSTVQNLLDWQLQQYKTEPASQLPPLPEPADQYYSDPTTYRIFAAMVTRAQVQWQILGSQRNAPRSAQRRALYVAWLNQVLPLHRVVIAGMPVGYSITDSLPPVM
jgi:hypothetical protein